MTLASFLDLLNTTPFYILTSNQNLVKEVFHLTTVTIRRAPGRCRLTAVGHATGNPAVCAAVSGLVYALAGYLKNLERAGAVTLGQLRLEPGDAVVEASGSAACPPFGMAAVGLMQIAEKYPKQVNVKEIML